MSENGLLLDTNALIWLVEGGLAPSAAKRISDTDPAEPLLVSSVSAWELGLLVSRPDKRRRLGLTGKAEQWFRRAMSASPIVEVPLSVAAAFASSFLPGTFHSDPADRLLVATARELDVAIVTRDRKILAYAEAGHVKAIAC